MSGEMHRASVNRYGIQSLNELVERVRSFWTARTSNSSPVTWEGTLRLIIHGGSASLSRAGPVAYILYVLCLLVTRRVTKCAVRARPHVISVLNGKIERHKKGYTINQVMFTVYVRRGNIFYTLHQFCLSVCPTSLCDSGSQRNTGRNPMRLFAASLFTH